MSLCRAGSKCYRNPRRGQVGGDGFSEEDAAMLGHGRGQEEGEEQKASGNKNTDVEWRV